MLKNKKKKIKILLQNHILKSGVGSICIKLGNGSLVFLISVLLARKLGPESFGSYSFVYATLMLLSIPVQSGFSQLMVRETAITHARAEWSLMRGIWLWSTKVVLFLSLVLVGITAVLIWYFSDILSEQRINTFYFGLPLIPLLALGNLRGATLQGLGKVIIGQLANKVVMHVCALIILGILYTNQSTFNFTPSTVMAVNVLSASIAFTIGTILLNQARPTPLTIKKLFRYDRKRWLHAILPLTLIAGFQLINRHTDIVMLGIFKSDTEVGIYQVVITAASLIIFGLQAINIVVMPQFARLHDDKTNHAKLQQTVTYSARIILLFALPIFLVYIIYGELILQNIFGNSFASGRLPLSILSIGQLCNAIAGPVGILLNMTGNERDTLRGVAIAAIINVILNLILIPPLGMTGAAIATSCSLALWNILLWRAVHSRLNIESTPLISIKSYDDNA